MPQTSSVLKTFCLAMSLYPEVQKRAQAELDTVVGHDRFPDFEDRASLIYLQAIMKESLRWMTVAPLGLAHCTIEDDEFGGYFIPAGTIVMANIWQVLTFLSACCTFFVDANVTVGHACTILSCTKTRTRFVQNASYVTASWTQTSETPPTLSLVSADGVSYCLTPTVGHESLPHRVQYLSRKTLRGCSDVHQHFRHVACLRV